MSVIGLLPGAGPNTCLGPCLWGKQTLSYVLLCLSEPQFTLGSHSFTTHWLTVSPRKPSLYVGQGFSGDILTVASFPGCVTECHLQTPLAAQLLCQPSSLFCFDCIFAYGYLCLNVLLLNCLRDTCVGPCCVPGASLGPGDSAPVLLEHTFWWGGAATDDPPPVSGEDKCCKEQQGAE